MYTHSVTITVVLDDNKKGSRRVSRAPGKYIAVLMFAHSEISFTYGHHHQRGTQQCLMGPETRMVCFSPLYFIVPTFVFM